MLTEESYYNAWLAYCLAGGAALFMLHRFTQRFDTEARILLLFAIAGLMFAPARPDAEAATWAPAVIVAVFSFLAEGGSAAAPGIRSLLSGQALFLAMGLLLCFVRRRALERKRDWR